MRKGLSSGLLLAVTVVLLTVPSRAAAVTEEAQRHFDRAMAAVEMAQTPEDYEPAIREFLQARTLAPDWPDVYYNLGLVQDKAGHFRDAADSLRNYLRLAPNAADAATVRSLANKAEFKAEQEITRDVALDIFGSLTDSNKWRFVGDSSAYRNWVKGLRRDGDSILLTYVYNIKTRELVTLPDKLGKDISTFKTTIAFLNFCGEDCDVVAHYEFKIISKNKVEVYATEIWPKVGPIDEKTKHLTFEYIRL